MPKVNFNGPTTSIQGNAYKTNIFHYKEEENATLLIPTNKEGSKGSLSPRIFHHSWIFFRSLEFAGLFDTAVKGSKGGSGTQVGRKWNESRTEGERKRRRILWDRSSSNTICSSSHHIRRSLRNGLILKPSVYHKNNW